MTQATIHAPQRASLAAWHGASELKIQSKYIFMELDFTTSFKPMIRNAWTMNIVKIQWSTLKATTPRCTFTTLTPRLQIARSHLMELAW